MRRSLIQKAFTFATLLLVPASIALTAACGSSTDDATGDASTGGDGTSGGDGSILNENDGGTGIVLDAGGSRGTLLPDGGLFGCVPGNTQCTNCIDDDGDGKPDWVDPECTGPLDNDESSFATGIPGDNVDPCKQDCFFDGNSGAGDDKCEWDLRCDKASPGDPKCPYDPQYKNCPTQQKQLCLDKCQVITPNGCDCFGCCELHDGQKLLGTFLLGSTCSVAAAGDPTKCKACTQTTSCINTCDKCEICIGKPTVPAECAPTVIDAGPGTDAGTNPTGQVCSNGQAICNTSATCNVGYYCLTGCCAPIIN